MDKSLRAAHEAAAFEQAVLENGLTVRVRTMPGFSGMHAVFGTRFGSLDRSFLLDGRRVDVPAGTAHFLEHKMFEKEEGDAFSLFARTGANANAYTNFDSTAYLFSASGHAAENLDILLGFVSHPYFTAATVEKEQGIIGQEIRQYDDAPDWQMLLAMFRCLYASHPIRDDIAGTTQSIAEITPEVLYACANAFYRPQNMVLAVAGSVTMDEVLAACRRADMPAGTGIVRRLAPAEPAGVAAPYRELKMAVAKPVLGVGFKGTPTAPGDLGPALAADILCELVCGSMTPLFRTLYDKGLVSADFAGEALDVPGAFVVLFDGETSEPETVRTLLLEEIARLQREGIDEKLFTLCKNQMYGERVQALERVSGVAGALFNSFLRGRTPADSLAALAAVTPADVNALLASLLRPERSATVVIRPAEGDEA